MGEKYLFFILAFFILLFVDVAFLFPTLCKCTAVFFLSPVYIILDCLQVKRRRRVNVDVSKIFHHIRTHKEQPGRQLFCLPSGLATFTCFALRSVFVS